MRQLKILTVLLLISNTVMADKNSDLCDSLSDTKLNTLNAKKVIEFCKKSVDKYPNNAKYTYKLARGFDKNGQHNEAEYWYQKTLKIKHDHAFALHNLGVMYEDIDKKKDKAKALKLFKKACSLNVEHSCVSVGNHFYKKEEYTKAILFIEKGAKLGSHWGLNFLGWIYQNGFGVKKDIDKAIALYKKATNMGYLISMQNLAKIYEEGLEGVKKDKNKAEYYYQKSLSIEPNNRASLKSLVDLYIEQGKIILALDVLKQACKISKNAACNTLKETFSEFSLKISTTGHIGKINNLIVSKDKKYFITTSTDKTIKVWDSNNGKLLKQFYVNTLLTDDNPPIITLSPSNEYIAIAISEGIQIYDIKAEKIIKTIKFELNLTNSAKQDITFSEDGNYLILSSFSKTKSVESEITIWGLDENNINKKISLPNGVYNQKIKAIKYNNKNYILGISDTNGLFVASIDNGIFKTYPKYKNLNGIDTNDKNIALTNAESILFFKIKEIAKMKKNIKPFKKIINKSHNYGVKYSPNGLFLATGGISLINGKIREFTTVYNKNYNKFIEIKSNYGMSENINFLDNQSIITTNHNGEIFIRNLKNKIKNKLTISSNYTPITSIYVVKDKIYFQSNKENIPLSFLKIRNSDYKDTFFETLAILKQGNVIKKSIALNSWLVNSENTAKKEINFIKNHIGNTVLRKIDKYTYSAFIKNLKLHKNCTWLPDSFINCNHFYRDIKSYAIIDYLKDKKIFVVLGMRNGNIFVFDVEKFKLLTPLIGHAGAVQALTIHNNKLFSGSDHGIIKIWSLDKIIQNSETTGVVCNSDISIFVRKDNEYIAWTNEGFFTSSKKSMQSIYFQKNKEIEKIPKIIKIERFYDTFYRPDLVRLKLTGNEKAYQKAINGLSFKEALKNPPPKLSFKYIDNKPTVSNIHEYEEIKTKKEKVEITFDIQENDNGGVGLIRIYQEGKLVQTIGEGEINKQSANAYVVAEQDKSDVHMKKNQSLDIGKFINGNLSLDETTAKVNPSNVQNKSGKYTIELDLISGDNEIMIEAFNKSNTVSSYRESINIKADIKKSKPNLYVITAGVKEFNYKGAVNNLTFSEKDALDIQAVAENMKGKHFNEVVVIPLLGKELTKKALSNAVKNIAENAELGDAIVFYISTHGRTAGGNLFLLPQKVNNIDDYITFKQTFNEVQSIKALRQIFIIDACESGSANDYVSSVYDARSSVLARASGVHMLLASTRGTKAFEGSKENGIKNGVFTHKILQALKNKKTDGNKDNFVSILELSKTLKKTAKHTDKQYPVIRNVGNDVIMGVVND
ncbi:MAG: hypothetical protein FE834_04660 [Gammaproteobacteria bacterium]|nr:hypothetical protein [Gammaproteobacteria bacterium]